MLTVRGHAQIRDLASRVDLGEFASLASIEHSPYLRARETAQLFKEAARLTYPLRTHLGLTPDSDPLSLARELGKHEGNRLLVGHNPLFECLAGILLIGDHTEFYLNFQTAACIALERFADATRAMPYGYWKLCWFIIPAQR
jgi:phosphohistidine phosphatase